MRTVGILGGMGPEATVLLMQRVLAAVPARDDADHLPLIVHQNPRVPSRIRHLIEGTGESPGPVLAAMARALEAAGADALAMPCNTAHNYAPEIVAATALPFLDMRAATCAALPRGARVGMLASPAVRLSGAFDAHFDAAGLVPVWPEDDSAALAVIRAVKAGSGPAEVGAEFAALGRRMAARSDILLVACTEMSLLTGALTAARLQHIDSLDRLVAAIVDFAAGA